MWPLGSYSHHLGLCNYKCWNHVSFGFMIPNLSTHDLELMWSFVFHFFSYHYNLRLLESCDFLLHYSNFISTCDVELMWVFLFKFFSMVMILDHLIHYLFGVALLNSFIRCNYFIQLCLMNRFKILRKIMSCTLYQLYKHINQCKKQNKQIYPLYNHWNQ
jgi:hypothetical protein